jgi:coenzyme F420-reducing hydrogenase gamma subunit
VLLASRERTTVPYHEDLPKILDRVYGCSEIVKVDYTIPGCPTISPIIFGKWSRACCGEKTTHCYILNLSTTNMKKKITIDPVTRVEGSRTCYNSPG